MTTTVPNDAQRDDLADLRSGARQPMTTGEALLWTLFGLALLVGFLVLLADDFQLRNLLAVQ